MKRVLVIGVSLLVVLNAAPVFAACDPNYTEGAETCMGKECGTIGTTKLDSDQTNIIACLYKDSTKTEKVWKASSVTDANFTCPTGQVLIEVKDGKRVCGTIKTANSECWATYAGVNNTYGCRASCDDADFIAANGPGPWFVTGGGFHNGAVFSDKGRNVGPSGNGYSCDTNIGLYADPTVTCSEGWPSCNMRCWATCATIVPVP